MLSIETRFFFRKLIFNNGGLFKGILTLFKERRYGSYRYGSRLGVVFRKK